jgi:hypothetical protein
MDSHDGQISRGVPGAPRTTATQPDEADLSLEARRRQEKVIRLSNEPSRLIRMDARRLLDNVLSEY